MKLTKKRGNGGHVTSYTLSIGSKEARELGFINEDGSSKTIKKTVDLEKRLLIFELEPEQTDE